ncbi:Uncharacterized protein dnm_053740 [Desulfonema magnum]|uniref:Uncharacterized protein n=1 Tax=Desulfonema magnum TaxID=45655 RepID=A0A975GPY8_9BACT|nr:Uncharacterized protein dnm_053740 [Desulfonema magnum]
MSESLKVSRKNINNKISGTEGMGIRNREKNCSGNFTKIV